MDAAESAARAPAAGGSKRPKPSSRIPEFKPFSQIPEPKPSNQILESLDCLRAKSASLSGIILPLQERIADPLAWAVATNP